MNRKVTLSILWIVLTVNYIFCDVFTLMFAPDLQQILQGKVGDVDLTQEFLLIFAVVMEIPMMMILLSRLLKRRISRPLHLVVAPLLALVQAATLMVGSITLHYAFFSVVEIGLCLAILWLAWRWDAEPLAVNGALANDTLQPVI